MKSARNIYHILAVFLIVVSVPVSIYLLSNTTSFFNRAYTELFGTKAELVVNLTDSYPTNHISWSNLAQGGEESRGMLEPVIDDVARLNPNYIRIDHIYDFYGVVERTDDGELIYNWTRFDEEIENITSTGARPFLSLSYMPADLSSGNETDTPINWVEWQELVRQTVEHVSGVNGLAIPNVYYEVWNEPDLFGDFKLYGDKNYLTMYLYSERGARQARNTLPFKIGGPATTSLYKNWFTGLLDFARNNSLRVDFYSWHRYSLKINDYEEDYEKVLEWVSDYPEYQNIEFVISESGFDSEVNEGYDGDFSAVHTLVLNASLFNKLQKVFTFEIKDGPGPEQYWGRWGLLTHEDYGEPIAKPRYKALEFLNNMRGSWHVVWGQGTWVKAFSTTDGEVIRTLIVNFDPFGKHSENVPITFLNLPSDSFTIRRINFLGGSEENQVNIADRTSWSTQVLMQPNSAVIMEIIEE